MTTDIYYILSTVSSIVVIVLTALDYVRVKEKNGKTRIKKTGIAIILTAIIISVSNFQQREMEKIEKKKADSTSTSRYNMLYTTMHTLKQADSILLSKADSQLYKCGYKIQGNNVVPIITTSVSSINQKGGQTGVNFTNNY